MTAPDAVASRPGTDHRRPRQIDQDPRLVPALSRALGMGQRPLQGLLHGNGVRSNPFHQRNVKPRARQPPSSLSRSNTAIACSATVRISAAPRLASTCER